MALFEDIGRTNTLRAVTGDIANLALRMRQDEREETQSALTNANLKMEIDQKRAQDQEMKKPIPVEALSARFKAPANVEYANKLAQSLGYIEEIDGVPIIRAGNSQKIQKMLSEPSVAKQLSANATSHYRGQVDSLKQQISEYTASKEGKDLSNDKTLASLQNNLKMASESLVTSLEKSDKINQYAGLIEKGFDPKEVRQYMMTGDESVLTQPVSESKNKSTPTDIDDYVSRANEQSMIDTGRPLSPGKQNEAALDFKRAQAKEVAANKIALNTADAATIEKVKYNGEIGKQLAVIATTAKLIEEKGEITPVKKKENAQKKVAGSLASLTGHYLTLDSLGSIINVDKSTMSNVYAASEASDIGQFFGRVTGSESQSVRNSIKAQKPLLMNYIRQASEMGARGLDSEKELEFYLQAATDEKRDLQANIAAIAVLDEAYGDGSISSKLREKLDPSIIKNLQNEFSPSDGGMVSVVSPDGTLGSIPKDKLEAALSAGYKKR